MITAYRPHPARYPLHRNFTQHSLKVMLAVYDAVVANDALPKEQRKPLWAIGESLKLVPNHCPINGTTPMTLVKNRPQ